MAPFWQFSSRNRKQHGTHPKVAVLRESILLHWAAGWTQEAIAYYHGVHVDTVNAHLRRARRAGDNRAQIRQAAALKKVDPERGPTAAAS